MSDPSLNASVPVSSDPSDGDALTRHPEPLGAVVLESLVYNCGCSATGSYPLPRYCGTHGSPPDEVNLDPDCLETLEIELPDPRTPGLDEALAWSERETHHPHVRVLREEVIRLSVCLTGCADR